MLVPAGNLLFTLVFLIGIISLQFVLSKQSNKWLGVILPIITFSYSLLRVFNTISFFDSYCKTNIGIVVITVFIIFNIPTIVMLTIYFVLRKKVHQNSELDRMNIQDLE